MTTSISIEREFLALFNHENKKLLTRIEENKTLCPIVEVLTGSLNFWSKCKLN